MLDAGEVAPDFERVDQDGRTFRLSSLRGRWTILYFYPKDETTGCTAEACAFRDNMEAFRDLGAEVVGVSTQDRESHRKFAQRHALNFRLVADPDKRIARAFGVLGLLGVARRVSFLIDGEGRIRDAYRSEISPTSHVDRARQKLREFGVPPVA